jgi:hypothetical protein
VQTDSSIDFRNELESKNGVSPATTSTFIHLDPKGKNSAPTLGRTALLPKRKTVSDFFQFIFL